MAHSVELLLDPESESWVVGIWAALSAAGLPSQGAIRSGTNRPHVTLVAAEHISPEVDTSLASILPADPLRLGLTSVVVFGGKRATIALGVVMTDALMSVHREVAAATTPHATRVFHHARPGDWTPHVTIARRVPGDRIGEVLGTIGVVGDGVTVAPQRDATAVALRRWDSDTRTDVVFGG
ncbi:2'-5' RNA ligase family protein [Gordonia jinhuaensis]|uniref:2'-5' RNA ligase superfamily protein n=1 Tax=Gordonia jinhuaensis TaxID=1517702 RepID=A0A916TIK1_9ACTN|nr:2'-5' RNA ligase family protein [Gordonia jinhuaensis]GGB47031.1 hypothetical protein GCM10011489_37840 [Gordonia jinhuaensis]